MSETTVAASVVIDMLQYLEHAGHAPAEVCRAAGIDDAILARPDARVPGSRVERLWTEAERRTGDPLVGLHMAEVFHPAALDIVGYVLLTCRTVGEMLERAVRYAGLLNDGMRVELVHEPTRSYARIVIIPHVDNHLERDARQMVDSWWVGLARQLRLVPATPVMPVEVWFTHRVADPAEHRRILGAPLRFGAAENRFYLARADLARPIPSANPALFAVFDQHAEQVLRTLGAGSTAAGRVARLVAERLRGRVPPIGEIAAAAAMSARQLQRALQAEGRTYQQVLDDVRCALARRLLAEERHSVSQIAFLVGFSEPAAFHRAFKRWTGITPAMVRRA